MEKEKLISLVESAQQGDPAAMEALFAEFYNDVYYFAVKTVKDSDTACDITQETFMEIIRTIGNLHEPASFAAWMRQIAYHQCTRYFRQHRDAQMDEDEDGNSILDNLEDESEGSIPSAVLEQEEFRQTILSMIDQLSEEQRSAVMMYYFDELSVSQISQIQGVSEGTVKSRLNYARKAIKKSVEDYEKKHDIKLHSFALLPLFMLFFGKAAMPKEKEDAVRTAFTEAVENAWNTAKSSAAASAGTQTSTAAATTITKTAATKAAGSGGIIMKLSTLPLWGKIIAAIVAVAIIAGAAVAIISVSTPKDDSDTQLETPGSSKPEKDSAITPGGEPATPSIREYEAGTLVAEADGTVKLYGENNTVTNTYTWDPVGDINKQAPWNEECLDITQVVIADGITGIGINAFDGCKNLTNVTIPNSVTSVGEWAFANCTSLTFNEYDNAKYLGNETNKYLLLVRGNSADITSCEINPNTKLIYPHAFAGRTSLTDITIPEGVTFVGDEAFCGCTALTNVSIPDSVTTLGGWVFAECPNLTYNMYDNAQYLGNNANQYLALVRANSKDITSCQINPNTKFICNNAFGYCEYLDSITIPNGVIHIGNGAFLACDSLTGITIPDSVTIIDNNAFNYCDNLASVNLGNGVTSIGQWAFSECNSLTNITIPDSVTSIGTRAFNYCTSLTSITIPDSVTDMGQLVFYNCTSLTSITIPDSVPALDTGVFCGCTNLSCITIPDSVTNIGIDAFLGCTSLTSVSIPESVTVVGEEAFYGCTSLTAIIYNGTVEQWESVTKEVNWNKNVPATYVQCTDGSAAL